LAEERQRGRAGRFAESLDTVDRDAAAFKLRARFRTYEDIARELGFYDGSHARRAIKRHSESIIKPAVEEYRREMDSQLDEMQQAAIEVLERRHYTISNGAPVYLGDPNDPDAKGDPLEDDGPVLAAIATILRVQERRAKLWGLDAPTKVQAEVRNVKITIEGSEDV
jgi:hypothetical protein